MESLYLLLPLSAVLVLLIIAIFAWALHGGQFDELEHEGERILEQPRPAVDGDQCQPAVATEEFLHPPHAQPRGEV